MCQRAYSLPCPYCLVALTKWQVLLVLKGRLEGLAERGAARWVRDRCGAPPAARPLCAPPLRIRTLRRRKTLPPCCTTRRETVDFLWSTYITCECHAFVFVHTQDTAPVSHQLTEVKLLQAAAVLW